MENCLCRKNIEREPLLPPPAEPSAACWYPCWMRCRRCGEEFPPTNEHVLHHRSKHSIDVEFNFVTNKK